MTRLFKRAIVAATFAGALAVPALPASAQAPVTTGGGLVNVTLVDVLSGNEVAVQVPVSVAANICDVSVAVLARDLSDGSADCSNDQQTITLSRQRGK